MLVTLDERSVFCGFLPGQECVEPGQRMLTSDPAALCVAVSGDDAAVGYHGDGLKLFSLKSGT